LTAGDCKLFTFHPEKWGHGIPSPKVGVPVPLVSCKLRLWQEVAVETDEAHSGQKDVMELQIVQVLITRRELNRSMQSNTVELAGAHIDNDW